MKQGQWFRTCQECGYEQAAIKPNNSKELTDSYSNSKCRKCKSMSLDYGKPYDTEVWEV